MKNYYLKRIDELRTNIGSDRRPTPVSDITRGVLATGRLLGDPLKRTLGAAGEGLQRAVIATKRKEAYADALKRRQDPQRVARLKAAAKATAAKKARELASKQAQAALRHRAARLRSSGNAPFENPHIAGPKGRLPEWATYLQIGYILAESMGLIEEGIMSNLARGIKRVAVGTPTRYRPGDIKIQPRYDKRTGLMTNDEEPIEKGKAGVLTMLRNLKKEVPINTPPKRTPKEDEEFKRTRDLLWQMQRDNITRHWDQRTTQGRNDRYDDLGRIKRGKY